ncbi:MAG: ammonium transporter [Rhodospirillales bacterium]
MTKLDKLTRVGLPAAIAAFALAAPAHAQEINEDPFIFNSLSYLMHGFMVMWMAAGFCMLEAGLVRSKNVATMCVKNIGLYSIAGIMFYLVGYQLMYADVGSYFGTPGIWSAGDGEAALLGGADGALAALLGGEDGSTNSAGSDWFFQMVFVATAASIVSGTLAERIKLWPFLLFVVVLTAVLYPIQGSWSWGGGWLSEAGFLDFAGSTIVHSVGGWAALTGAIILGARKGKFVDGRINPIPGSSMPLATLGTFILWLGWFGFNGGSQLAMGSAADVISISNIYINTNIAAAAGVVIAMIMTQVLYGKVDLSMALNGALGGLVAITAEPLMPAPWQAILIGGIGGALVVIAVPLLDKLKIDDVVGAISVHLVAGIWGTLAVLISNPDATFLGQIYGIVGVGAFMIVTSSILWFALKLTIGIRVSEEDEELGLDRAELGMEAYPEFRGSQTLG